VAGRNRELLASSSCPRCGSGRGDSLLVVVEGSGDWRQPVRAQCVRCGLSWAPAEAPELESRDAVPPAGPIGADELIELHRALGEHRGDIRDLLGS
jgi:hypothetical protein